jgi:hypothetical protein
LAGSWASFEIFTPEVLWACQGPELACQPASLLNQLATRYALLPCLFVRSFIDVHNPRDTSSITYYHLSLCVPLSSHSIISSDSLRLPSRRTLRVGQGACWRVPGKATNPGSAPVWTRSERRSPVNVEPLLLPHLSLVSVPHQQRYRAAFARRLLTGTATGRIPVCIAPVPHWRCPVTVIFAGHPQDAPFAGIPPIACRSGPQHSFTNITHHRTIALAPR